MSSSIEATTWAAPYSRLRRNEVPQARSFRMRTHLEMEVSGYQQVFLSIPTLGRSGGDLRAKDLLSAGEVPGFGKFTLEEHLDDLVRHRGLAPDRPLLAFGMRNNLVNERAIVISGGRVWFTEREQPRRSRRPYYGLGMRDGGFVVDTALGENGSPEDWPGFFCAGIPVVWDDLSGDELFDLFLTEASDHSHVFDLPRGNHPLATDGTRAAWSRLHEVFLEHLESAAPVAAGAMRAALSELPFRLTRCGTYLHAVLGSDSRGALVAVLGHGLLEDLGKEARRLGCRRAVCVENSGSLMPTFLPQGISGPVIPLLRAPNFRPKGRALLVLVLDDASFDTLA